MTILVMLKCEMRQA